MTLLNKLFHFILLTTQKYNIDESHGVSHSMNVLRFSNEIFNEEVVKHPILKQHEKIVYVAASIHDMCDKKYMDQHEGIQQIEEFLSGELTPADINVVKMIVSTMSYSVVKNQGFPNLGPYRRAYHVVREADLLSAYDFDRCLIYNMYKKHGSLDDAFQEAFNIFDTRVFKHNDDGLFTTGYGKTHSKILEANALNQIATWKRLVKSNVLI